MKTLVLGASGKTGLIVTEQLLKLGKELKIIVRPNSQIPSTWRYNKKIKVITTEIANLGALEMSILLQDCSHVISCLGHNPNWKGIYGSPRKLVTNTLRLISSSMGRQNTKKRIKLILMSSAGCQNRDQDEAIPIAQRLVLVLLRIFIPPHSDNEQAVKYLCNSIGISDPLLEWVAIRPDDLTDQKEVSAYEIHPSPIRSAIFDAGKTSRNNVAHFMVELATNNTLWKQWKGKMPVIYNYEKVKAETTTPQTIEIE